MLVACEQGNLELVMLLSSFGADRERMICALSLEYTNHMCWQPPHSLAELVARRNRQHRVVYWLRQSLEYTALQHIRILSVGRAKALLRSGAHSPFAGTPSPAELARFCTRCADSPAAELIRAATSPWSPFTHNLWGHPQRALAVELCRLGYLLAYYSPAINSSAFASVWVWHVMPQVLSWELHYGTLE